MRRSSVVLLALLLGFFAYRVALTTQPSDRRIVQTYEGGPSGMGPSKMVPLEFDALTGFPNSPAHMFLYPYDGMNRAFGHWLGSVLFGLATVVIATWWLGRRRRNGLPMRAVATSLAVGLTLAGCGLLGGVPLKTVEARDGGEGSCMLMYWIADVAADPEFGTVDKQSGQPFSWPSGYVARWAGTEVEVLDRSGRVVLTTGQRYRLSPSYVNGYPNPPTVVCAPEPCTEKESAENGGFIKCKLGESGPL